MANVTFGRSVGTVQYTNIANSYNKGSAYGAAFGSNYGPWGTLFGAAIGGTIGVIGGFLSNKQADKTFKQYSKAADLANQATLQELARNIGQVNRQRTILALQTQAALEYTQNQALLAGSQSATTFAAADQIGNQLIYIQSKIQDQQQEQAYLSEFNYYTQIQNTNQQIINLTNTAKNMFTGVNVTGGQFSWNQALNDIMGSVGAMSSNGFSGSSSGSSGSTGSSSGMSGSFISDFGGNSYTNTSGGMGMSGSLGLA